MMPDPTITVFEAIVKGSSYYERYELSALFGANSSSNVLIIAWLLAKGWLY